ncbi:unnamed protein product, partial [Amoebophrya sp. A25]|eukprot:GSA25T00008607001.1
MTINGVRVSLSYLEYAKYVETYLRLARSFQQRKHKLHFSLFLAVFH